MGFLQPFAHLLIGPILFLLSFIFGRVREKVEFPDSVLCSSCGARFSQYASECPHCDISQTPRTKNNFHDGTEMTEEEIADFLKSGKAETTLRSNGDEENTVQFKSFSTNISLNLSSENKSIFDALKEGELFVVKRDTKNLKITHSDGSPEDIENFLNEHTGEITTKTTIEYNGKKYNDINDLPADVRKIIQDKNNNSIPDIFE